MPSNDESDQKKPLFVTEAMLDLALGTGDIDLNRHILTFDSWTVLNEFGTKRKTVRPVAGHLSDEEFPRPSTTPSLFDLSTLQTPPSDSFIVRETPSYASTLLKNPLTGLVANIMTCTKCGYKSAINCAVFSNISLAVPSIAQVSIEQLLQTYITPEAIHDYKCDKCTLVATVNTIDVVAERMKSEIEALKGPVVAPTVVSPSGKGKKKKNAAATSPSFPTTPIDTGKIQHLEKALSQLELDRDLVAQAAKFNTEAKLPKHISLTKQTSPLTTKQIVIATPPKSLCLHMQRSIFTPSGHVYKSNSRVLFGEYLDLGRFCMNSGERESEKKKGWADIIAEQQAQQTSYLDDVPPPLSVVEESGTTRGGLVGGSGMYDSPYASVLASMNQAKLAVGSGSGGAYPYLYRLHAVVIHYGSHDSGHFVTYRRCPHPLSKEFQQMGLCSDEEEGNSGEEKDGLRNRKRGKKNRGDEEGGEPPARWFRISDEKVDLVRNVEEEVYMHASQFAYMLFYERVQGGQ
ncbi:hypothetical protein HDU79_010518 [Rhizoclosmatium sp. JEL0117]|nr:hypothetical protein HDU79_010518 [Rhizoclosmatium sp. JEL0117]